MQFLFLTASTAWLAPIAPVRNAPAIMLFGSAGSLPVAVQEAYDARFQQSTDRGAPALPPLSEVAALWVATKKAFGNEAAALEAVKQNPTIISPLYCKSPQLILDSKAALVECFEGDTEEALAVMRLNPAVLQCGGSLRSQSPAEVKRFAVVRSQLDRVPPAAAVASLSVFLLAALANTVLRTSDDELVQQVLSVLRPAVGSIGALLFTATAANAARAQVSLRNAEAEARKK